MAKDPKPALTYEPPSHSPGVTRQQFRALLLLIFLHLVVTVQSTYAPGVTGRVRQWWAERKAKAELAAAAKQALALEQQCMNFAEPAGKPVWEEEPASAEKLLAGSGYREVEVEHLAAWGCAAAFPAAARAVTPPLFRQVFQGQAATLGQVGGVAFLHRLTSAAGHPRLAFVYVQGTASAVDENGAYPAEPTLFPNQSARPRNAAVDFTVRKTHSFVAIACEPGNGEKSPQMLIDSFSSPPAALVLHPAAEPACDTVHYDPPAEPGGMGKFTVQRKDRLRVFAGQPDPADPSHFTIAYELDGRPGTLDGRLMDDDTIHLVPRQGKVVGGRWYPQAR